MQFHCYKDKYQGHAFKYPNGIEVNCYNGNVSYSNVCVPSLGVTNV